MRSLTSFLPVLLIICTLGVASCMGDKTLKKPENFFESNPDAEKKEQYDFQSDSTKVKTDSAFQDTTVFIFDPALDSTESSAQPLRKPTFRHFYNYMKIHKKGPIVMIPFF